MKNEDLVQKISFFPIVLSKIWLSIQKIDFFVLKDRKTSKKYSNCVVFLYCADATSPVFVLNCLNYTCGYWARSSLLLILFGVKVNIFKFRNIIGIETVHRVDTRSILDIASVGIES